MKPISTIVESSNESEKYKNVELQYIQVQIKPEYTLILEPSTEQINPHPPIKRDEKSKKSKESKSNNTNNTNTNTNTNLDFDTFICCWSWFNSSNNKSNCSYDNVYGCCDCDYCCDCDCFCDCDDD